MNPEERKEILQGKNKKKTDGTKQKERKRPVTLQDHVISWAKTIFGALIIVMVVNGLFIQSFVVPTESMEQEVLAGDFVFVNRFVYGGSTPQTIPFLNIPLPYLRLPGFEDPERRDVIVFIYPGDRDQVEPTDFQYYLKRCVAVAGDTLEVIDGYCYVNGVKETLPDHAYFDPNRPEDPRDIYQTFPRGRKYTRDHWGPMRIPKKGDKIMLNDSTYREWAVFIQREGHDISKDGNLVRVDGEVVDSYTVERDYVFGMGDNRNNSEDSRYWGFIPEENVVGSPLIVYWSWENREVVQTPAGYAVRERSLWQKLGSIRWGRIFNGID